MSDSRACFFGVLTLGFLLAAAGSGPDVEVLRGHTAKLGASELLQFSDKSFRRFVFDPLEAAQRRPYRLVLLLTVPNSPACGMLRKALGAVKRAVQGVPGVPDLFFAELSSEKGKQSFKDIGISHAPVLLYVPHQADGEAKNPVQYRIESMEHLTDPEVVAEWIAQNSGLPVHIPQPLWKNPNVQTAAAVLTGLAILYKLPAVIRNYDHHLIYFFGVMCAYVFTFSGTIYNAIHGVPWYGHNHHTGEPEVFMGEMRSQYGAEGIVIVVLNLVPALLFILLTAWVRLFYSHKAPYYPFKV
ncbi:OST3 / OST6 family protein [Acanthamoeba castellanii str. Neff]|uniref:OST3 / OST6 family protein n=1 Tax=Acanthamoeba castellanii (strain ATCC 30010 / Neff) TaxID=1257118 RepID=L8HDM5_ACACF|nr:OST3 / OST6 family protein [Acanthamoeba castellanii str. Neff]ELR22868.1 OST3 / OST6 family protein [Acanthamoeba castellanii str. Neff]